jgi:glycosyltransferase involved in cell wall biosynthesis
MHVLIGLTYYRPHFSGLTIYTERLARALVRLGHQVTVLTSRFDPALPEQEIQDGVHIIRPAVALRLSKGVIMPSLPGWAMKLVRQADVVNLHLPQMDAAYVSWMARAFQKPVVMTYHCDLKLPSGLVHWVANQGSNVASMMTAQAAQKIVTNSLDYAENTPFLRPYLAKTHIITPPIELEPVTQEQIAAFCQKYSVREDQKVIGMVARLASEKGVEYLVEALPEVLREHPNARVLYVGQYQDVLGEEEYAKKLSPMIERLGEHWTFLGLLPPDELTAFFHIADVNVSPSINSTESFGMVQVEAMVCGTPAVASDLPGVRRPVQETGMGRIVPPRDAPALAKAITAVLDHPEVYSGNPNGIREHYSSDSVARQYEAIFKELTSST